MAKKSNVKKQKDYPYALWCSPSKQTHWLVLALFVVALLGVVTLNNAQEDISFSAPGSGLPILSTVRHLSYFYKNDQLKLSLNYPTQMKVVSDTSSDKAISLYPLGVKASGYAAADFFILPDDLSSTDRTTGTSDLYEEYLKNYHAKTTPIGTTSPWTRYAPSNSAAYVSGHVTKKLGANTVFYFNDENLAGKEFEVGHIFYQNHNIVVYYNKKSTHNGTAFNQADAEKVISSLSISKS